jgi:CubicO group peptidase (beta-lactamase class C family)
MQGAGGLSSTANDMAKFVQWHMSHGQAAGKQLLQASLLDETYKPNNPAAASTGYGLGTAVMRRDGVQYLGHSGGGFGFLSDVYWYPSLGLGAVVLTNSVNHDLQGNLIKQIFDDILTDPSGPYVARLAAAPVMPAGNDGCPTNECLPSDLQRRIAALARQVSAADLARWQGYVGDYTAQFWQLEVPAHIKLENGQLFIGAPSLGSDMPLTEVQPGLLFSLDGEALDLRGQPPTYRGVRLTKMPAKG